MASRRDVIGRIAHEVNDLLELMPFLDENQLTKDLPKYVSDGVDKMPSTRLFDGDLKLIMVVMEKLERQIGK